MTLDEICQAMKTARKTQGMTIAEMARRSGFTDTAIGWFEHGGNPRLETLTTYAEVLGMEIVVRERECNIKNSQCNTPDVTLKNLKEASTW